MSTTTQTSDREIISQRTVPFSRALVFKAWTDPTHLAKWWGPKGFTNTFHEFDLKPGGHWRFVMHGPDGANYNNESVFVEIVEQERIVFDHVCNPLFRVVATFEEKPGGTAITFRMIFPTEAQCEAVKPLCIPSNEQNFDRLEAVLATMPIDATNPFVITRNFDAPRDLVWKVWSEPEHMKHWWAPKGFELSVVRQEFRPGGLVHYCLRSADGHEMWGKSIYREISAPGQLVFVNSFSDADASLVRHPMSATWPLEMLTTITFTERDGKTDIRLTWIPLSPNAEERQTFDAAHDGMRQGWTGTFDQLEAYLKQNP